MYKKITATIILTSLMLAACSSAVSIAPIAIEQPQEISQEISQEDSAENIVVNSQYTSLTAGEGYTLFTPLRSTTTYPH